MDKTFVEKLKEQVICGKDITYDDALRLSRAELSLLASSANEIRKHCCGNICDVCSVISVKEGQCTENCKYCAQSAVSERHKTTVDRLGDDIVVKNALADEQKGSDRIGLVASGRRLSKEELVRGMKSLKDIQNNTDMSLCASFGLLGYDDFKQLKACGLSMIHNNLETSPDYFPSVCTSHTQQQKKDTIRAAQSAGLKVCSGSLFGMGESIEDRIALAFELKALGVDSAPMNVLNPRKGTPFCDKTPLTEEEYVRIVAIFRFVMPKVMIRLAAGRGRYADNGEAALAAGANAVISGDFLTTAGTSFETDLAMIKRQGFVVRGHSGQINRTRNNLK